MMTERKLSKKLAVLSLTSMLALSAGLGSSLNAMGKKKNMNKGTVNSQEDMSSGSQGTGTTGARQAGESSMAGGGWQAWSEKAWRGKLNLTSEQQEKWRQAEQDRMNAVQPVMDRNRDNFQKLNQQLKSNATEEDLRSTLDQIDSDRKKLQNEQDHYIDQIKGILTPKQQAQMVSSMQGMMGGARGRLNNTRRGNMGSTGSSQEKKSSESSESSETQEKSTY